MSGVEFKSVVPILAVQDVLASADYFQHKLGFEIDFLYGEPPFYGSVSRGPVCLHLHAGPAREDGAIVVTIEVSDVHGLHAEFEESGAEITQAPTSQSWGGTDMLVRDPDGNVLSFVTYDQ